MKTRPHTPTLPVALLLAAFVLAACSTALGPQENPALAATATRAPILILPTPLPVAEITQSACPNPECVFARATNGPVEPLRLSLPTPGDEPLSAWRPPQYPVPLAIGEFDHFYFARPIAADVVNWPVANYRYGGINLTPEITHTGVDIPTLAGTPVLAAGPGVVTWAGWGLFSGAPENQKDPYGIAVSIRHDFGYGGEPIYTVYAHLRDVNVAVGQWVNTGEKIGEVGDTGYTTGPHLHFELRLGKDSYYFTRNPELWLAPPQGWGVLAGTVLNANRERAHSRNVNIRSLENNQEWTVITYGPEAVNPDEYYNENMVISDLPAGDYEVKITFSEDLTDKTKITIKPGRVTYFLYRATYGFTSTEPPAVVTPTPATTP